MNLESNRLNRVTSLPTKTIKNQNKRKRFNRFYRRKNSKYIATLPLSTILAGICPEIPAELPVPPVVGTNWEIEAHRKPYDTDSQWYLKQWFMELHKDNIPEDELVPLAQAFASMEGLGCTYAPELMDRVLQLGEPVSRYYRDLKQQQCSRTLVSSQEAVRMWLNGITYAEEQEGKRQMQIAQISPICPPQSLAEVFQNIIVVNNSLQETAEWFEWLGGGTITITVNPISCVVFEVKAYAANFFISKASGSYQKAYAQCVADFLEILKNYCYQVNYIQRFSHLHYNVERLLNEDDQQQNSPGRFSLKQNNIGYRMLQKLGWTGGPLGYKQSGILNPIEVAAKHDRRGLGCTKGKKKKQMENVDASHCELDLQFYHELMLSIVARKPYYDLIFSPEFTENERIILTRLAAQQELRCETRLTGNGQAQFVIKRYPLPPHKILAEVLIEQHPIVSKYYQVLPPKVGLIAL
uniref:G-patch domain-containing protein n=1 Tax=Anopheles epiroticus TaxID=199890 RepID=A0A182PEK9_9DIPT